MVDNRSDIWVIGTSEDADLFARSISSLRSEVETGKGRVIRLPSLSQEQLQDHGCLSGEFYFFPGKFPDGTEEKQEPMVPWFRAIASLDSYRLLVIRDAIGFSGCRARKVDIHGYGFYEFRFQAMSQWGKFFKRFFDFLFSLIGLILLSPLILACMVMVKIGSKGPVFYSQERIGKGFREFKILKFRSMYVGAEKEGPALSSQGDSRITPWGIIMRRYRIDELPQFINVLRGDMSFIGYRPERSFFIRQIEESAPYYHLLMSVEPGVSSLGMTRFGYAENVSQMLERLNYDMDYLSKVSVAEDLRVLLQTIAVVIKGLGK